MQEQTIGGLSVKRGPSRSAVRFAVVGLIVLLAAATYFRFASSGPLGIDVWWHGATGVTPGSTAFAVAVFFAEVGGGLGAAACTAIAAALLLALRRPREAGAVVSAAVLGIILSESIKSLVLRPRPWDQLYASQESSFPSGHSMGAAALAVSLALVLAASERVSRRATQWAWAGAAVWIALMMWSRAALHVHWLSDTLAGALLGVCSAILTRRWWFGAK